MRLRDRLVLRMVRAMAFWGLIKHPYGRAYARRRLTPLGGTDQ